MSSNQRDRYVVGARGASRGGDPLAQFRQVVLSRPDAALVSGKSGSLVVVELSKEAFNQLNRQFGSQLIIEPDSPLKL
ncbi:MAG: hypothetical protein JOZ90_15575 [Alphaproteobacteria bacterium]|nr:hypothetical protein [Alphaproteobacteria bacterium]MBV9371718.1 hypothetical protein [Alphaproteobacteria bacterium]MBV9902494.1 hypothetical protein [Alphaproteobacteria bacterium]